MIPSQTTCITDCNIWVFTSFGGRISRLSFVFCLCLLFEWTLSQDSYWCLLPSPSTSPSNCWSIWKKVEHNYYQILSKQTLRSKHARRNKLSNNEKIVLLCHVHDKHTINYQEAQPNHHRILSNKLTDKKSLVQNTTMNTLVNTKR